MAEVTGYSKSGRVEVKGHCNIFWIIAPIALLLVFQPVLLSYTTLGIVLGGLLLGGLVDFIAAFIIFAIASESR